MELNEQADRDRELVLRNGDLRRCRRHSNGARQPDSYGGERRSVEPLVGWVQLHRALLPPLQGASQVLLQARFLPRPLRMLPLLRFLIILSQI